MSPRQRNTTLPVYRGNRGMSWEKQLNGWHAYYLANGLATVFHTHPPVSVVRGTMQPGGKFTGFFRKEAPPDYVGSATINNQNIPVIFDAKQHDANSNRWPLSAIADHQASDLSRFKGFSFVALRWGLEGFLIPWSALRSLWEKWKSKQAKRGEGSLTFDDVCRLGYKMANLGWHPTIEQIMIEGVISA